MRLGYVERDWQPRRAADKLFLHMLKRGGMGPLRRQIWYWAVCLFGKKSTMPKPHKGRRYPGIVVLLRLGTGKPQLSARMRAGCVIRSDG